MASLAWVCCAMHRIDFNSDAFLDLIGRPNLANQQNPLCRMTSSIDFRTQLHPTHQVGLLRSGSSLDRAELLELLVSHEARGVADFRA